MTPIKLDDMAELGAGLGHITEHPARVVSVEVDEQVTNVGGAA